MGEKSICVLPLGNIGLDYFEKLKKDLGRVFGFKIRLADKIESPDYAYDKEKGKYNARIILNEFNKINLENCEKALVITDQDLFSEDLNYIFGLAETNGRNCIISTKRLNLQFYNAKDKKDLFYKRILKEIVHELGHVFSLKHCQNKKCVMHFSNSVKDTDEKESEFCEKCEEIYEYMNK